MSEVTASPEAAVVETTVTFTGSEPTNTITTTAALATSQTEEEWEIAGKSLSALKFDGGSDENGSSSSVVIPNRLRTSLGDPVDVNFFGSNAKGENEEFLESGLEYPSLVLPQQQLQQQQQQSQQQQQQQQLSSSYPIVDEPIDVILESALKVSRERSHAINIERSIHKFVLSDSTSLTFPPGLNSYRRMLAYRIAQRFHLSHTTNDDYNGDRTITLYKTRDVCIPRLFLESLPIDAEPLTQAGGNSPSNNPNYYNSEDPYAMKTSSNNSSNNTTPRIMKRHPSKANEYIPTKDNSRYRRVGTNNFADKETEYMKAKARIFGEDGQNSFENTGVNNNGELKEPSESNPSGISDSNAQRDSQTTPGSNNNSTTSRSENENGYEPRRSYNGNRRTPVDANNWKEVKSIQRDKDAERSDPDFTRRNVTVSNPTNINHSSNNHNNNNHNMYGMYPQPVPMQQMNGTIPYGYSIPMQAPHGGFMYAPPVAYPPPGYMIAPPQWMPPNTAGPYFGQVPLMYAAMPSIPPPVQPNQVNPSYYSTQRFPRNGNGNGNQNQNQGSRINYDQQKGENR